MGALDKYLGILLIGIILFWIFSDPRGTTAILGELSKFNTNAIAALQGRNAAIG